MHTTDSYQTPRRTLEIVFRSGKQLEDLCRRGDAGPVRIRIHATGLCIGESVKLAITIPPAFRAWLRAVVIDRTDTNDTKDTEDASTTNSERNPRGDTPELTLELTGLTARLIERMRAHVQCNPDVPSPPTPPHPGTARTRQQRIAAGTPCPERLPEPNWVNLMGKVCGRMTVSELLHSNKRLRKQLVTIGPPMKIQDTKYSS